MWVLRGNPLPGRGGYELADGGSRYFGDSNQRYLDSLLIRYPSDLVPGTGGTSHTSTQYFFG